MTGGNGEGYRALPGTGDGVGVYSGGGGSGGGIPGAPLTPSNSQPQVGVVLQLQVLLQCESVQE